MQAKRMGGYSTSSRRVAAATRQIPHLEALEPRLLLDASVIITEFLADNTRTYPDQSGSYWDWIEVQNVSPATVNLAGWHLTDKPDEPNEWWHFPAVDLPSGQCLVVYASDKGTVINGEIHTDFKLNADGEPLALLDPNGVKASEFSPAFPPQDKNISYGLYETVSTNTLVPEGATAHVKVPTDGSLGLTWIQPGFNDSGWTQGPTGIGFEITPSSPGAGTFYYGPFGPGGTWNLYEVVTTKETWTNANTKAGQKTQGGKTGHLVALSSAAENTFVKSMLTSPAWIGLNDAATEGTFVWTTGEAVTYTNWYSGEPNASTTDTDAVRLSNSNGQWYDERINNTGVTNGYVIEYELNLSALGPAFTVQRTNSPTALSSIAQAAGLLDSTSSTLTTYVSPFVNFADPQNAGGGRFVGNLPHPGDTTGDDNNFALRITGTLKIPTSGDWTFNVNSDDGFRLKIIGGTFKSVGGYTGTKISGDTMEYPAGRGANDSLGVIWLDAGEYPIQLDYYEGTGGSAIEFSAAFGSYSSVPTPSPFRLVGDTASGGLALRGIGDSVATNIAAAMRGINTSAYVRIPFTVAEGTTMDHLHLGMKYDDGFVAYLDGVEVARANAPAGTPAWNSQATAARQDSGPMAYQELDVFTTLAPGNHVLAIHGLNVSAADTDFLLMPRLDAITVLSADWLYFTTPSPGLPNTQGMAAVSDTHFSNDRGFYDKAFDLTLVCDTPGTTIRYTTDSSAPTVAMGTVYTEPLRIDRTTIVRAAAFKTGWQPSNVDTQTYLFLDDVLTQTGEGFPTTWGTAVADYAVDPNVVNDPAYRTTIENDLKAIPSMSLVMDMADLFGPNGLYSNPTGDGVAWERAGSLELIQPDGGKEFQVNSAVRIYGGVNRDPRYPKHTFRVIFKSEYGPTHLDFPLFDDTLCGDSAVDSFNTIILRGNFNNSWPMWGVAEQMRAMYVRDAWSHLAQLEMGWPASHTTYVHLYVNGLYWGLYNPVERPDAAFMASYFGGEPEDWDVLNSGVVVENHPDPVTGRETGLDAWNEMMNLANWGSIASGGTYNPDALAGDAAYQAIQQYLDVPEFIDYMILNFYTGNQDWDNHNWYAARKREPGAGYKFFTWDSERTLEDINHDKTAVCENLKPSRLYWQLRANPEFRLLFADRVYKHLFNDGALTPEAGAARFQALAAEIDRAIVGESARWGDYLREPPYTRNVEWVNELNRVLTQYFPQRTPKVMAQFGSSKTATVTTSGSSVSVTRPALYPSIDPPAFNQHGGVISPGFTLTLSTPSGSTYPPGTVFYYTLDGTDPRLPGGDIAEGALPYGTPVTLTRGTVVKARAYNPANGEWSALDEATFSLPPSALRLTEIMYHPPNPAADSSYINDDFQFIEFQNTGTETLNLTGYRLSGGVDFTFPDIDVGPGGYVLVVASQDAFQSRYPAVPVDKIAGQFIGNLSHAGEPLQLDAGLDGTILDFEYEDGWYPRSDGEEFSLVVRSATQDRVLWDQGEGWRASWRAGGSPGEDEPAQAENPGAVLINELLAHQDEPTAEDWLELYNTTDHAIDLGGWYLSDSDATPQDLKKYRIPAGTVIPAYGYLVLTETADFGQPFSDSSWIAGTGGIGYDLDGTYNSYISTNVQSALYAHNASIYLRTAFNVADPSALATLTLRVRYDDGFVAYLNGTEIARRSAPAVRPWNAAATAEHPDEQAVVPEDIDVTAYLGSLRAGANLLAIHGLNTAAADRDFLLSAELVSGATPLVGPGAAVRYRVPADDSLGLAWTGGQFAFSELGDQIILTSPGSPSVADPTTLVAGGYREDETFGATDKGVTLGRYIKSTGGKDFVAMSAPTRGGLNAYPAVGEIRVADALVNPGVVINEILYAPLSGDDEFIELYNLTGADVPLYDPDHPANTWKFTEGLGSGGINYSLPPGATIPAHGYALVVPIDPAAFSTKYNVPAENIYGPYPGWLSNSGEAIELSRPGTPESDGTVPYYPVDRVKYDPEAPWPTRAGTDGSSLIRLASADYGNDAANWGTGTTGGSPGRPNVGMDATPPAVPTDLAAVVAGPSRIDLAWNAAADPESGLGCYKILRNDLLIGRSMTTAYSDTKALPSVNYSYRVSAVNRDDLESPLTDPPAVARIVAVQSVTILGAASVRVAFTETVGRTSAENAGHYTITYPPAGSLTVSGASLAADNVTVTLTLSTPMAFDTLYTLTPTNIVGLSGWGIAPDSHQSFYYYIAGSGTILREWWTGITGTTIPSLIIGYANYPNYPTGRDERTTFEAPTNLAENYGTRMRGYVTAPLTGNYYFFIASDDNSELWFDATGETGGGKTLVASVTGSTTPQQWDKYASQKSAAIALQAGQRYYIEVLHKEGTGSDNLAVGWQLPGGTYERPIPATRISPFFPTPDITVTLLATDASASETGLDKARFTVTRTGNLVPAVTVYYTAGGTASPGDYNALSGYVTIPANAASATIDVTPVNDLDDEPAETVILTLSGSHPTYAVGTPDSAQATIADNDLPKVRIVATDSNASEAGPDPGTFTFTRIGDCSVELIVPYGIEGSASGDDYTPALGGSVTFAPGVESVPVVITPVDDHENEANETLTLRIADNPSLYRIDAAAATVTIEDNEYPTVTAVRLNGRAGRGPGSTDQSGIGVRTLEVDFSEPVTFTQDDVTVQAVDLTTGESRAITPASILPLGDAAMVITLPDGSAL
ncbi:MAG: lamin tail domain-containing protein, partial [Planctomycetota bacterium]|nr:lamin tail domain-containing protein [Planctomycetota bacterium]